MADEELEEVLEKHLLKPNDRIVTDRKILKEQAILGLFDTFYFGAEIIGLRKDEFAAPACEVEPMYKWIDRERPPNLHPKSKWLDFWSSSRFTRKTYTVAVWLTQQIVRFPNVRQIIDGQERQNAGDTVLLIREWLEMPEVVRLYGSFISDSWGKFEFTISQRTRPQRDPTVRALGLDNSEQGKRCDIRWWDDLIGKSNNNPEGIKKVEDHLSASMPIIKPGGRGLYTCTRWNALDPSTDGFTVSGQMGILRHVAMGTGVWFAPPPRGWFGSVAQSGDELFYPHAKPGELLYPSVLSQEVLDKEKLSMSASMYSSQYDNNPLTNEDRPFMEEDLIWWDPVDENGERSKDLVGAIPYIAVDPASGKMKTQSKDDSTFAGGYVKWFENYFHVYVTEWTGGRWPVERIQDTLFEFLKLYHPRRVFPEVNIGHEFIVGPWKRKALEIGISLPLEEFSASLHGTGKKDVRIEETLAPLFRNKRIFLSRKLKNTKGPMQLLQWTPGGAGHDDYPDVLASLIFHATKKRGVPALGVPRRPVGLIAPGRYRSTGV